MTNFSSFLLGSLVTLACAFFPFWRSSRQLEKEAQRLAKISNLVTRGMEEAGIAKFNRNSAGEAIGLIFDEGITEAISFSSEAAQNTKASSPP